MSDNKIKSMSGILAPSRSVALVTGGSSSLGGAISLKLAAQGIRVVLHFSQSKDKTENLQRKIQSMGGRAFSIHADLNNPKRTKQLVKKTVQKWGRLDLLINNASIFNPTPFHDGDIGTWEEIFRVNVMSPFMLSAEAGKWLRKTRGCIVNITDIYGQEPRLKNYAAYCASKAALISLTKWLAFNLGPEVRVNAVSPGAITFPNQYKSGKRKKLTDKTALKRKGQPEDIANAVWMMASNHFLTGQILNVDGGRFI